MTSADCEERKRSSSLGRSRSYRAKHWAFLLENFRTAKDELCDVCEKDRDILACREVLLILANYSKEFAALIDLIKLNDKLEQAPDKSRPVSLSWEIRKPGSTSRLSPVPPREPSPAIPRIETCHVAVQTVEEKARATPRPSSVASRPTSKTISTPSLPAKSSVRTSIVKPSTPIIKKPSTLPVAPMRRTATSTSSPTPTLRKPPPPVKQTTSSLLRRSATCMNTEGKSFSIPKPLNISKLNESTSSLCSSTSSKSWAETVKGGSTRTLSVANNGLEIKLDNVDGVDDNSDGWKVVNHHRAKQNVRSPSVPEIVRRRPVAAKAKPMTSPKSQSEALTKSLPSLNQRILGQNKLPLQKSKTTLSHSRNKENEPIVTKILKRAADKPLVREEPLTADRDCVPVIEPVVEKICEDKSENSEDPSPSSSMLLSTDSIVDSPIDSLTKPLHVIVSSESVKSDSASDISPRSSDRGTSTDFSDGEFFMDKMAAAIWINKQGLSLADQREFLDQIELRVPGRATKVHEKLSSPRKGITEETLRKHERRQAKALEHREKLREERAQTYRDILRKVEEHRAAKEEESKTLLQRTQEKQSKANKNREEQLRRKVQKAHDEKEKVQEIAFINTIEAQNKRHDIFEKEKVSDKRLQEIQKKQQLKLEEKAAREAAAEERRKALEEEWQLKVNEILEKRADRDRKLQQQQQERETKRQVISKLNELVRERVNAPGSTPYETKKMCSACNVLITSEVYLLSHLKSSKHQETMLRDQESYDTMSEDIHTYSMKYIIDAPIDEKLVAETESLQKHLKAIQKKRCRKLKQRIVLGGKAFLKGKPDITEPKDPKKHIDKQIKEIVKVMQACKLSKGVWPSDCAASLERQFGDVERLLSKGATPHLIKELSSPEFLALIFEMIRLSQSSTSHVPYVVHMKTFTRVSNLLQIILRCSPSLKLDILQDNTAMMMTDCLYHNLVLLVPEDCPAPPKASIGGCTLTSKLLQSLQVLWDNLSLEEKIPEYRARIVDLISYTISIGVIDKLMYYFTYIQKPHDSESEAVAEILKNALNFVAALLRVLNAVNEEGAEAQSFDATQLLITLRHTDAMGVVALLYSTLLCQHKDGNNVPCRMSSTHIGISVAAIRLLNQLACVNLSIFQEVLSREGISLQIRHITSYLLWYCSHHLPEKGDERVLLHQVVLLLGFFAMDNADNQNVIHAGGQPTVLQLLTKLPFDYFCDNELRDILMPTLLACCLSNEQNTALICEEVSPVMLLTFLEEKVEEKAHKDPGKEDYIRNRSVWTFQKRFPERLWPKALEFFQQSTG